MYTLNRIKEEVLRQPLRGFIVSDGDKELSRNPEKTRRNLVHSAAKSITAIGVGFALEEKLLDLEEPLSDAFRTALPSVEDACKALGGSAFAKDQIKRLEKIRLKHLLSNTSGFQSNFLTGFQRPYLKNDDWTVQCLCVPVEQEAGSEFLYNDANYYLISKLLQKRAGQNLTEYLLPRLFAPLGIRRPTWELDPDGDIIGCGGLLLNLDELHRIGLLCLDRGRFGGEAVVPENWIKTIMDEKTAVKDGLSYGYGFWCAPGYSYMFGLGGIYCFISKDSGLLITADGLVLP